VALLSQTDPDRRPSGRANGDDGAVAAPNVDPRGIAQIGLFILAVVAAVYVSKALLLPVVSAFVLGTMLAPVASFMERRRIPRPLAAIIIVFAVFGAFLLLVGLISAPLLEWTTRLPELIGILKQRAAIFDRPLALLNEVRTYLGGGDASSLEWPKIEWVQPTLEFLSPTFVELLLFAATLVLFIAGWTESRRTVILTSSGREQRLRILRTLNAIERNLGTYLQTVTLINVGVGVLAGLACALARMPDPVGLGALAATLNFIPIIGPVATFVVLLTVGVISQPYLAAGLAPALIFALIIFLEGHFVTPAIIGRQLELNALAVFLSLAFWTWMWGPIGAFLSSPLLIVALIIREHLWPEHDAAVPE
jgi:predicted PurR-regulated permease PerM